MFRKLIEDTHAVVDLGIVIMIGIAFAGLMVVAYIVWEIRSQMTAGWHTVGNTPSTWTAGENSTYLARWNQTTNVTSGFDNAVNLILVAITIFILALAISALLMLRGRRA